MLSAFLFPCFHFAARFRAIQLMETLKRLENDRKKLLSHVSDPSWEVPHHFHLTSLEHFLGQLLLCGCRFVLCSLTSFDLLCAQATHNHSCLMWLN